jgi:hypothetical protein
MFVIFVMIFAIVSYNTAIVENKVCFTDLQIYFYEKTVR